MQSTNDRQHTIDLFLLRYPRGARAGRLTPNIDDGSTFLHQSIAVRNGSIGVNKPAAIAETVRRDIENADEYRTLQIDGPIAALPCR